MKRIPRGVQRGEAKVIEGRWGNVEIRVSEIEGSPRDLPFDGDLVYLVPAEVFDEWRAKVEASDGD